MQPVSAELDVEILKVADQHFLHDLQQFWQRASFFVLVQGGLLSVFASVADGENSQDRTLALGLAAFGGVLALFWGWVSHLTSLRIATWRSEVMRVDDAIDRHALFRRAESHAATWWRNPTTVAVALPIVMAVGWVWLVLARYYI